MTSLKILFVTALVFFAEGMMARDEYIVLKKDGKITLAKKGVNIHVDTLGELVDSLGLLAKYGLEYTDISSLYITGKMTVDSSIEKSYSKTGLFQHSTTTKSLLEINEGKVSKISALPVVSDWKISWINVTAWMIFLLSGVLLRSALQKRPEKIIFLATLCLSVVFTLSNGNGQYKSIFSVIIIFLLCASYWISLNNHLSRALFLFVLPTTYIMFICFRQGLWLPYLIACGLLTFGILSRYLYDRMKEPMPRYESDIPDR